MVRVSSVNNSELKPEFFKTVVKGRIRSITLRCVDIVYDDRFMTLRCVDITTTLITVSF